MCAVSFFFAFPLHSLNVFFAFFFYGEMKMREKKPEPLILHVVHKTDFCAAAAAKERKSEKITFSPKFNFVYCT